jgi:hypothetical protein
MALGDSDLGLFFQDGVKVVLPDGTSAMANLDWPESVDYLSHQLTPGVVVGKPTITYATASLVLKSNMAVTVYRNLGTSPVPKWDAGTPYVICHVRRTDDGNISVAELNKAQ